MTCSCQAQDLLSQAQERSLAPGVLTVAPSNIDVDEGVVYPRPIPGLDIPQYTPTTVPVSKTLAGQLGARIRYRDVWQLDFAFKNLRHMEVQLPVADGQVQVAEVWYLIYRVRNRNEHLSFQQDDQRGGMVPNLQTPIDQLDGISLPGRFFPSFLLEGWVQESSGSYVKKAYRDSVLPNAIDQIARRERLVGKLMDNVEISKQILQPSTDGDDRAAWGVATWLDIDPRVNFVTVSVQGLSNAFRTDQDGQDDGQLHRVKTLQANFWRPGDAELQGDVFRPGILIDGNLQRQLSLVQKYDLPGPELGVYRTDPDTLVTAKVGQIPANYDLDTLDSEPITDLSNQQMPPSLVEFLQQYGFQNAENLGVATDLEASQEANMGQWTLTDPNDGSKFVVKIEPIIWRIRDGKIEFVGGLDYFWDYRYIH